MTPAARFRDPIAGALADPTLLTIAAVALLGLLLLAAVVTARLLAAPRAVVTASGEGGVVVSGGPDLARLLHFVDPFLPRSSLRPSVVLVPTTEVLTVIAGEDRAELLWDEIRRVERRRTGLGTRSEILVEFARTGRPRRAVLRLVEEPGALGLRRAPEESVDRFERRLRLHTTAAWTGPDWGSRPS
ncbi:hypothetical protein [Rathayibacter sp. VKM Ac-2630]|uniref:hypothetical protein n=1 Tax=Rathayibacter sp. VKM Ac-2630 TaxID=1938617 RepID=UPI0011155C71|nr:hypothetical protein [Rathayibacter sp. VKM Ac-2630]